MEEGEEVSEFTHLLTPSVSHTRSFSLVTRRQRNTTQLVTPDQERGTASFNAIALHLLFVQAPTGVFFGAKNSPTLHTEFRAQS